MEVNISKKDNNFWYPPDTNALSVPCTFEIFRGLFINLLSSTPYVHSTAIDASYVRAYLCVNTWLKVSYFVFFSFALMQRNSSVPKIFQQTVLKSKKLLILSHVPRLLLEIHITIICVNAGVCSRKGNPCAKFLHSLRLSRVALAHIAAILDALSAPPFCTKT